MRISDWSSDVCSSDLRRPRAAPRRGRRPRQRAALRPGAAGLIPPEWRRNGAVRRPVFRPALHKQGRRTTEDAMALRHDPQRVSAAEFIRGFAGWRLQADRKSVVSGKSGSVRVDLGGRRIIKKKRKINITRTRKEEKL